MTNEWLKNLGAKRIFRTYRYVEIDFVGGRRRRLRRGRFQSPDLLRSDESRWAGYQNIHSCDLVSRGIGVKRRTGIVRPIRAVLAR